MGGAPFQLPFSAFAFHVFIQFHWVGPSALLVPPPDPARDFRCDVANGIPDLRLELSQLDQPSLQPGTTVSITMFAVVSGEKRVLDDLTRVRQAALVSYK